MVLKDFGAVRTSEEFSAQVEINAGGEEGAMVMNSRMFISNPACVMKWISGVLEQ